MLEKWRLDVLCTSNHPGARFLALGRKLHETYRVKPFDYVAYEMAAMGANNLATRAFHSQLLGVLFAFCADMKIVILPALNIKTIKKFATGNGNADKSMMLAAAAREGLQLNGDNDLADAFFVLRLAEQKLRLSRLESPSR